MKNRRIITRRQAVKSIVSGVSALAAYHTFPTTWSKPIVEQIFLPAHAATSGSTIHDPCTTEFLGMDPGDSTNGLYSIEGYITPSIGGVTIVIHASVERIAGGTITDQVSVVTSADGTYGWTPANYDTTDYTGPVTVTTSGPEVSGTATCYYGPPPNPAPGYVRENREPYRRSGSRKIFG